MSRKMIEIHDLEKFYGAHHVLKKINLDVEEGEVVVIIGPSGSGKVLYFGASTTWRNIRTAPLLLTANT